MPFDLGLCVCVEPTLESLDVGSAYFKNRVLLYSPGWTGTHHVDHDWRQTLRDLLASAS